MHFGALAPLPLRLGTYGVTAAEYCRLAIDAAAAIRSAPIAVVRTSAGAPTRTVLSYLGRNGSGLAYAPTAGYISSGTILTWPATYIDELGTTRRWDVTHVRVHPEIETTNRSCGIAEVQAPTVVWGKATTAGTTIPLDTVLTFIVYGTTDVASSDYGAATDKVDCETERVPYALQYYRALQGALGSAYSTETTGLLHCENLAVARHYGWLHRLIEKLGCEGVPGTADRKLLDWCHLLNVDQRDSAPEVLRRRAASAYAALAGATPSTVDAACEALLGIWFVRCWRDWNDSMTPADPTYWPGINPGPSQWDIGGGCWLSAHANLVVEVVEPSDADRAKFLELANIDLPRMLDRMLPDHMTYNWATNVAGGFRLDTGSLDYEGLDP